MVLVLALIIEARAQISGWVCAFCMALTDLVKNETVISMT